MILSFFNTIGRANTRERCAMHQHDPRLEWTTKIARMLCHKPWSEEYITFVMEILTLGKCATETVNALNLLIMESRREDVLARLELLRQTRALSLVDLLWDTDMREAIKQTCVIKALDAAITHGR